MKSLIACSVLAFTLFLVSPLQVSAEEVYGEEMSHSFEVANGESISLTFKELRSIFRNVRKLKRQGELLDNIVVIHKNSSELGESQLKHFFRWCYGNANGSWYSYPCR